MRLTLRLLRVADGIQVHDGEGAPLRATLTEELSAELAQVPPRRRFSGSAPKRPPQRPLTVDDYLRARALYER